ncbi:PREDICTED: TBC1 domain family member 2B [Myotis brandtii]|uniref:TBC1 domain family member 2B n=1 Tax=Myotis brandtii TaxID=109478 RepID=UPI000703C7C2|nr:PREDICTED: TBC1 domain family member 2B [Myotis brandtii]
MWKPCKENSEPRAALQFGAPNRQLMTYWLQELQQKRWEYCNGLDMVKWDGRTSPTPGDGSQGLVARGAPEFLYPHPNASAEKARNVLAIDAAPGELVGEQAASQPAPGPPNSINFSLKQWGAELRNSMSSFRPGRGHDSRKSVFYTHEEWELLDPSPKDLEESAAAAQEERRRPPDPDTQRQVQSQQEELERLRKDLSSQKELVRLLQQTVRSSQYDKYFASSRLCDGAPQDTLALLHQKDDQILGLARQLDRLGLEKESLQQEVRTLKAKVGELSEQLGMLMETIQAKDEVIIKLSRQLSRGAWLMHLRASPSQGTYGGCAVPPLRPVQDSHHRDINFFPISVLSDNLQGYKTQNKFLNKEILELSALRRNAERRERDLMAKVGSGWGGSPHLVGGAAWKPFGNGLVWPWLVWRTWPWPNRTRGPWVRRPTLYPLSHSGWALSGLFAETTPLTVASRFLRSEYDIYGFRTVPEDDEEERLVAKVRALDLRSLSLAENQEVSTGVKWENYLAGTMTREMARSPELKSLIRAGIPHEHRSKNPASQQIELDLLRTLPNNKHYAGPASDGIQQLRNVLLAFSWRNPDIGYCQGLNRWVRPRCRPHAGPSAGLRLCPPVIFRFALALFKYKEEEILKLQDSMSIFKYLRYFTRTILDAR